MSIETECYLKLSGAIYSIKQILGKPFVLHLANIQITVIVYALALPAT